MNSCPFLFPFETRLMYFYISSLDRDRAMQKLIELNSDLGTSSSQSNDSNHNERIVPKLDRKKKTINRAGDLIKQADAIISEFSIHNKPSTLASTMFSYASSSSSSSSSLDLLAIRSYYK